MLHDNAYTVFHRYPHIAESNEDRGAQAGTSALLSGLNRLAGILRGVKDAAVGSAGAYDKAGKQVPAA